LTDLGGKTCIFSHPVYLFLREFSLQDSRGGSLQISAQSLSNRKGSLIQTGTGDFSLSLPGSVDNREGLLAANGAVRLDALSLDNRKGKVQAEQSPSLQKSPPTFLKPFVAGVCAALLAVSVAIPGWQFLTQPSPEEQHFTWGNGCKKQ
ncbi:TPA: hypothetical protein ACHJIP_004949, partial [Escherichia coli]